MGVADVSYPYACQGKAEREKRDISRGISKGIQQKGGAYMDRCTHSLTRGQERIFPQVHASTTRVRVMVEVAPHVDLGRGTSDRSPNRGSHSAFVVGKAGKAACRGKGKPEANKSHGPTQYQGHRKNAHGAVGRSGDGAKC